MKKPFIVLASSLAMALLAVACVGGPKPKQEDKPAVTAEESKDKQRARELITGESGKSKDEKKANPSPSPAPVDSITESDLPKEPTAEELKFLESYLLGLKYMVYFDEKANIPPTQVKAAITQANRYLIEQMKVQPIDLDTIEKKKADERDAFTTETGNDIDYIQFIAQKLNADVYVELSFTLAPEQKDGTFYASCTGAMKLFNASTGDMLGSVALMSPKTMSKSSADAAANNAVAASVWMAMPKMAEQAKNLLRTAWADGIRYDVVIQNTADARKMSQLKRQLSKKLRKVVQDSYSAQETRWSVFTFTKGDRLEDMVYDAADVAGLKDIYLVYMRGKSFVFNSGAE